MSRSILNTNHSTIRDSNVDIYGDHNHIYGHNCNVHGDHNYIFGSYTNVYGDHNRNNGTVNWAKGDHNNGFIARMNDRSIKQESQAKCGTQPQMRCGTQPQMRCVTQSQPQMRCWTEESRFGVEQEKQDEPIIKKLKTNVFDVSLELGNQIISFEMNGQKKELTVNEMFDVITQDKEQSEQIASLRTVHVTKLKEFQKQQDEEFKLCVKQVFETVETGKAQRQQQQADDLIKKARESEEARKNEETLKLIHQQQEQLQMMMKALTAMQNQSQQTSSSDVSVLQGSAPTHTNSSTGS